MTQRLEIYKCMVCGNIIEVLHEGLGELSCCNQVMKPFRENTTDGAKEKHVPVIEKVEGAINVRVGEVGHPMTKDHYIEWIEIIADGQTIRRFLNPGDNPSTSFNIEGDQIIAREYCNLHGLWKK